MSLLYRSKQEHCFFAFYRETTIISAILSLSKMLGSTFCQKTSSSKMRSVGHLDTAFWMCSEQFQVSQHFKFLVLLAFHWGHFIFINFLRNLWREFRFTLKCIPPNMKTTSGRLHKQRKFSKLTLSFTLFQHAVNSLTEVSARNS